MRIALVGYAGAGKTTAAEYMEKRYGLPIVSIGTIIKRYATERMVDNDTEWNDFLNYLQEKFKGASGDLRLKRGVMGATLVNTGMISPDVPNGTVKEKIRVFLEEYGEYVYDEAFKEFMDTIPAHCVNERLCRVEEGKAWQDTGGIIVHLIQQGIPPESEWAQANIHNLRVNGLIDKTILTSRGDTQSLFDCLGDIMTSNEISPAALLAMQEVALSLSKQFNVDAHVISSHA